MSEQPVKEGDLESAVAMFKALADEGRLRTLLLLVDRDLTVGELADLEGEKIGTVSARLKVLLVAHMVRRRRVGQTAVYSLADRHVLQLVENALEHAREH